MTRSSCEVVAQWCGSVYASHALHTHMARSREMIQVSIDADLIRFIDSWRPKGCTRTSLINAMLHEAAQHCKRKYDLLEEAGLEA